MHNLMGPTSPRETPKIHFIISNWGLLPRLTMEVEPQGPYIIMAYRKEGNTSPMGLQQHATTIYIITSFEVTNTTTKMFFIFIYHLIPSSPLIRGT